MYKIYETCLTCGGTGIYTITGTDPQNNPTVITQDPCETCDGKGFVPNGAMDGKEQVDDLTNKVEDVLDKLNDIKEKLDEM